MGSFLPIIEGSKMNQRILKQMGCADYKEWKQLLSGRVKYMLVSVKCLWENKIAKEGHPLLQ